MKPTELFSTFLEILRLEYLLQSDSGCFGRFCKDSRKRRLVTMEADLSERAHQLHAQRHSDHVVLTALWWSELGITKLEWLQAVEVNPLLGVFTKHML